MKKILVIRAHPREASFCNALVDQYIAGAKTGSVEIRTLALRDLELEPWLKYGWERNHDSLPLSDDLKKAKDLITWSDHIVFAYPTYWATPPALLKLFLEAITISGFAFKYHRPFFGRIPNWDRLLKGRTAMLLSTMDSPPWFMHLIDRDPGGKMMDDVLRFTGIKLLRKCYFGSVVLSSEKQRAKWLENAYRIGKKEGR